MKKTLIASALTLVLITGCASNATLSESEMMKQFPTLNQASQLLVQAEQDDLAFYAPEQIKAAQRAYDDALKQAKTGKNSTDITAKETVDRVNAAIAQTNKAKYVFEEAFNARKKALSVNADKLVPERFNDAEKQFKKMLAWFELGEDERAKRDINELKNQYLAIELTALKTNMLSVAKNTISTASKQDLDDVAPILFAQAQDEYQLALNTLEADRSNTQKANVHSNRAIWLIQRAQGIAEMNKYFKDAKFTEEQKLIWYQEQLEYALSPIATSLPFNLSNKEVVAYANKTLTQTSQRTDNLNSELVTLEAREARLAKDKDQAILSAQMELEQEQKAKREDNARFAGVQSLFNEEEAAVYRQLDNVLIRAQGFAFKPGGSEIESSNFPLLNKINDAISRFPNSKIVVSGHTDSTGSAELNLALSKNRAQTVANFMSQVGNIDVNRIESTGFGKEKPVASNETVEGRAQNRRVEILIIN
ncbi:OmpA family protein [Cognaticolwellia beringensis]|uniref:OmpA family protein n=1 Tax=Cognaticolwellia beringensis TaxID=1967665 RepID=A0A222G7X1_9GAMM|nr:OmpA family protein [Cognaticolwellia beringensis]ASP47832.1 OmpA family protein [Cognaticolwellia beringensis]|tara:strand:+ start:2931 stop:4364 length:1434 start_codon:yes stop_codon:yes gene_type:complete